MLKIPVIMLLIASAGAKVARSDKITFPKNNQFDSNCTLPNGQPGICRSLMYCETALRKKSETPKTCYFEGDEQFVCCRGPRPSELACSDRTIQQTEVVHGLITKVKEFPFMVC